MSTTALNPVKDCTESVWAGCVRLYVTGKMVMYIYIFIFFVYENCVKRGKNTKHYIYNLKYDFQRFPMSNFSKNKNICLALHRTD